MKKLVQLFKQTFIYGLATVFPRIISVLLVRVHTDKAVLENVSDYGNRDRTPIKDHGTIPLGIQSLIKNIVEKRNPQINWKRALKIFSSTSRKTRVYHTLKRVSKRFGTRPGIKIKRFQKLAVAIDTSGSIKIDDFNDFFGEIQNSKLGPNKSNSFC